MGISRLSAGTTYFYQLVAQNSAGTSFGKEMSFTTSSTTFPTPFLTPTATAVPTPTPALSQSLPFGLTIITHGYLSDTTSWVTDMANAINSRMGGTATPQTIKIESIGFPPVIQVTETPDINLTSGAAIIMVDWSALTGGECIVGDTTVYTSVIGDVIFDYLKAHPSLLQVPIHLIGHSRGGSVMSRLSERLGEIRVWVDQQTTLDPKPICDDAALDVWDNVLFADNYYQKKLNNAIKGDSVFGAYDLDLTDRISWDIENCGKQLYSFHELPHTYYHGTIDRSCADGLRIPDDWYSPPFPDRTRTGFYFTRTGGCDRWATSSEQTQSFSGLHYLIREGSLLENRVQLYPTSYAWSNATFKPLTNYIVQVNNSVDFTYYYQNAGGNRGTITFYLDNDTDPLNGYDRQIGTSTASESTSIATETFRWTPTDTDTETNGGTHYVQIKATNASGNVRYDYLLKPINVETATICKATDIKASPKTLTLKTKVGADVTVTVTGSEGCPVVGETVTATIKLGKKHISVSPQSADTDANGQARFTITATNKTGNAKVRFEADNVKTTVKVRVVK